MIIDKNSWHYRLLTNKFFFMDEMYPSKSLCLYFWKVVIRLALGIAICLSVASPLVYLMLSVSDTFTKVHILIEIWAVLGIFIFIVLVAIVITFLCVGLIYVISECSPEPVYKDNILVSYIKAKKNKLCPTLEFKEE